MGICDVNKSHGLNARFWLVEKIFAALWLVRTYRGHLHYSDCLYIQRVPPTDKDPGFSDDPDPTLEAAAEELQTLEEIMAKINEPDYFKKYTPLTTASEGKWALCPK